MNFIISVCCFFLLLFSLHLFFARHGNRLLNRLLAMVFFSRFGQALVFIFLRSEDYAFFQLVYQFFTPLFYIGPACFYLYVTCFIDNRKQLRPVDWLHFIPLILAIIYVMPTGQTTVEEWTAIRQQITERGQLFISKENRLFPPAFYAFARPVLMLSYLALSWYAVMKSRFGNKKNTGSMDTRWIFFALNAATFFQLIAFVQLAVRSIPYANILIVLVNCTALVSIAIFIIHNPRMFYGYLFVSINLDPGSDVAEKNSTTPLTESQTERLAENKNQRRQQGDTNKNAALSTVTADRNNSESAATADDGISTIAASGQIAQKTSAEKKISLLPEQLSSYPEIMKNYMEREQPYLQKDFQIVDLAKALNIPVHHCSFVINNVIGKNFRDWINGYRISHFLDQHPKVSEKMTIEAIAYDAGFKSLSTFYNAFKKETGVMPKAYFSQQKAC